MRVSGLTSSGDWRFGKGRAIYLRKSAAVRQNVVTRLRSFVDDWFADINAGSPWIELFGTRGTREQQILREVERVVLTTEGVRAINRLDLIEVDENRSATIQIEVVDVFDKTTSEVVTI